MKPTGVCMWWLKCTNPAVAYEPHSVIGNVAICTTCQDKLRAIEARTQAQSDNAKVTTS